MLALPGTLPAEALGAFDEAWALMALTSVTAAVAGVALGRVRATLSVAAPMSAAPSDG